MPGAVRDRGATMGPAGTATGSRAPPAGASDAGLAIGAWSGRVWLGSDKMAEQSLAPGMVLPQMIHGGPGRAGGGEELGGLRGLSFYLQRVALQGFKGVIAPESLCAPKSAAPTTEADPHSG